MKKSRTLLICFLLTAGMACSIFASAAVTGEKIVDNSRSIEAALLEEDWDYVTMQQASPNSGQYDTFFPYLSNLSAYIKERRPNATQVFHMTWAYQADSNHSGFANYGRDQMTMYNAIVTASTRAAAQAGISVILPSGVAWQKARATAVGDTLCRDGYHGNAKGQYLASAVWYEMLSGHSILDNEYVPAQNDGAPVIDETTLEILKQCAHEAVEEYRQGEAVPVDAVKVLAIGNSFSDDAATYISQMAMADNVAFKLGKLYIGGCSLATHWKNASENNAAYVYTKFDLDRDTREGVYYFADLAYESSLTPSFYYQVDQSPMSRLLQFPATGAGASITFTVPDVPAGQYSLSISSRDFTTRGRYQVSVNGAHVGEVDFYGQSGNRTHDAGTVTIGQTGDVELTLTVIGKYNSATGFGAFLNTITFTPHQLSYAMPYQTADGRLWGIEDTDLTAFLDGFTLGAGTQVKVLDGEAEVTAGRIGTGMTVQILFEGSVKEEYTAVVYGDIVGDGRINSADLLMLKRRVLELAALDGAQELAANADRDVLNAVNSADLMAVKRAILKLQKIHQK